MNRSKRTIVRLTVVLVSLAMSCHRISASVSKRPRKGGHGVKYFLLLVLLATIAFTFTTCHSPTGASNGSDTTSHAWNFTVYKLGDGGSSDLYDVAIINDTLACAVGEIYLKDSTGQLDPVLYNIASWNGRAWSVHRVSYIYNGIATYSSISWIYAINGDDIWFGNSTHWDGKQFANIDIGMSIFYGTGTNKMGGIGGNLYVVGNSGRVANYDGRDWQSVQSSTNLNFYDVYGSGGQVLAVASNPFTGYDRKIVQFNGAAATAISDSPITWPLMGVWFVPGHYYVVGQGIYEKTSLSDPVWRQDSVDTVDFFSCIRGNAWNDVFVAGGYGQLLHFNGKSWQSYQNVLGLQTGSIGRIAVKGNMMILVGMLGSRAVAVIGRR